MSRKFNKAIEIAKYWLDLQISGRFSDRKSESFVEFRDADTYTVYINDPDRGETRPGLEVVPKTGSIRDYGEEEREQTVHFEIAILKTMMIQKSLEEKNIKLDKKSRLKFSQYLYRFLN